MRLKHVVTAIGVLALITSPSLAQTSFTNVLGTSDLFRAGGNGSPIGGGGIGTLPTVIALNAGVGRTATFAASGLWSCCSDVINAGNGPEGGLFAGGTTNVNAFNRIAGLQGPRTMFLSGLFLGAALPGSAPAGRSYVAADYTATSFSGILLGQTFFIGDGLTGTGIGAIQTFAVPDFAQFLYLGVVDAFQFTGDAGFYDDNPGSVDVTYSIKASSTVPEPATLTLVGAGLLGLMVLRRRKQ